MADGTTPAGAGEPVAPPDPVRSRREEHTRLSSSPDPDLIARHLVFVLLAVNDRGFTSTLLREVGVLEADITITEDDLEDCSPLDFLERRTREVVEQVLSRWIVEAYEALGATVPVASEAAADIARTLVGVRIRGLFALDGGNEIVTDGEGRRVSVPCPIDAEDVASVRSFRALCRGMVHAVSPGVPDTTRNFARAVLGLVEHYLNVSWRRLRRETTPEGEREIRIAPVDLTFGRTLPLLDEYGYAWAQGMLTSALQVLVHGNDDTSGTSSAPRTSRTSPAAQRASNQAQVDAATATLLDLWARDTDRLRDLTITREQAAAFLSCRTEQAISNMARRGRGDFPGPVGRDDAGVVLLSLVELVAWNRRQRRQRPMVYDALPEGVRRRLEEQPARPDVEAQVHPSERRRHDPPGNGRNRRNG